MLAGQAILSPANACLVAPGDLVAGVGPNVILKRTL